MMFCVFKGLAVTLTTLFLYAHNMPLRWVTQEQALFLWVEKEQLSEIMKFSQYQWAD